MCVIMCKPAKVAFPPYSEIENCANSNGDGFGAMWAAGGVVKVFKTMKKEKFLKWYKEFSAIYSEDIPLVIHCRIKTHGSTNEKNCHPWTNDLGIGFCHNGILSIKNRKDMTDSETFFRDIWTPVYKQGGQKAADLAVEACIGTSRFCFLYPNGNTERWGDWQDGSVKGVKYSNGSWRSYTAPVKTHYGRGYFGSYWEEDDCGYYGGYGSYSNTAYKEKVFQGTKDEAIAWAKEQTWWPILQRMWDGKSWRNYGLRMSGLSFEASFRQHADNRYWHYRLFDTFKNPLNNTINKAADEYYNEFFK